MIDALIEAARLKGLARAGWVREGIGAPESVAAHSWGVAWLVLVLLPEGLDRAKALRYAVIHDLPEVRAGDITPHDGVPKVEKHRRERHALLDVLNPIERADELVALWDEYESQSTPESRFVRQLDKLDMAIQAVVYAEAGHSGLEEFLDSADEGITDDRLHEVMKALRRRVQAIQR